MIGLLGVVADSLRVRRYRRSALAVAAAYLLVYLWTIQHLVVSFDRDLTRFVSVPSVQVVPDWTSRAFDQVAPFSYEPVVAIYPLNHVTLLVSPVNVALGLLLGLLVGLNVAVALHLMRTKLACRRRSLAGLLGALPGFLTGFACCVPTIALVLGAQLTVALVAVRSWFFPVAVAALALALVWNARRFVAAAATTGLVARASAAPPA